MDIPQWTFRLVPLDSFPLYLYHSPQHPHRQDHYILQYHNSNLAVYLSLSNKHKWTWHITQLRRFSYDSKIPYVEIETGRFVTKCYEASVKVPYGRSNVKDYSHIIGVRKYYTNDSINFTYIDCIYNFNDWSVWYSTLCPIKWTYV